MAGAKVTKDDITPTLRSLAQGIKDPRNIYFTASQAKSLIQIRTERGQSSEGAEFGSYRTAPYYAPIKNRPAGTPKPAGGRTKALRGGRSMKSMYFKDYGEYKQKLGRPGKVTLSLTGKMLASIQIAIASPKKAVLFFASRLDAAKAHKHHTGYYPFFALMQAEANDLMNSWTKHMLDLQKRAAKFLELRGL